MEKMERSGSVLNEPPGVRDTDVTTLLRLLPRGRGQLRIAGYYLHGGAEIVVYDVLDEEGTRISDLRVVYPRDRSFLPPGTCYPIG